MFSSSALRATLPVFVILLTGSRASAVAYPHLLLVQVQSPLGTCRCAAALVAPSIALTSSHCVRGFRAGDLGTLMWASGKDAAGKTWNIQNVFLQDNLTNDTTHEDGIAIIVLAHDILRASYVDTARIPTENDNFEGNATLIGWAQNKTVLNTSTPVKATLSIIPCNANAFLTKAHLCAEAVENEMCPGYWAGFLICSTGDIDNFLCGILSRGSGCGRDPDGTFIFIKIAAFGRWIRDRISELRNNTPMVNAEILTFHASIEPSLDEGTRINKISEEPSPGCNANEFQCPVSKKCIHMSDICDGHNDCLDSDFSDEEDCRALDGCHPTQFACRRGNKCLSGHKRCNGRGDCYDFSDEDDCPLLLANNCTSKEFQCNNKGKCISQDSICDGMPNCGESDLSDEENCKESNGCHLRQFACRMGNKCIPGDQQCDGANQCVGDDISDEENCTMHDEADWECSPRELKCHDIDKCYTMTDICNGRLDCFEEDKEDESNCKKSVNYCEWNEFACRHSRQCIRGYHVCDSWRECLAGSDGSF